VVPKTAYVEPAARRRELWRKLPFAAFLLGYFFYFNWGALRVAFAPDDMMNMYEYWRHGPWRVAYSQFFLWHDFYRPMGGVFYLPLFALFRFNPVPYHAVFLALLLANVGLVYRVGRLLGAGALAAWGAALLVAFHAGLGVLYYNTAYIYDVMCSVFFLGALAAYIVPRSEGRMPRGRELAAFYICYLCALNSKEMAVTLPVVILAYEWLYHPPAIASREDLRSWLRSGARVAVVAGIIALPYLYGRVLGLAGMVNKHGYHPTFSLERVLIFQQDAIRDLFLLPLDVGWKTVVSVWAVITYLAWRRKQPLLRWCWVVMVVTPLPVEFLEGRRAAVLAIPYVGWVLFVSVLVTQSVGALAEFLSGEPGFRLIGRPVRVALMLGYLLFLWVSQNLWALGIGGAKSMQEMGELTAHVIGEFQRLNPHPPPHSAVAFVHDPFDGWDMYFIAELWFRDQTLDVRLQNKTPEPLGRFDYVFDYKDGRLVQAEHKKE
jgi:hypothetical protein